MEKAEETMVVGLGMVTLRLHDCHSLKGKRGVIKSVIGQIRNQFNASVAEVGANDRHQEALIGMALVGNDRAVINSKIDKIFNMVEAMGVAEVVDTDLEIMNV
jgi:uncharacterized protein YlxP (DUF503 family)